MDNVSIKLLALALLSIIKFGVAEFPIEAFNLPARDPISAKCLMQPDLLSNQCCIFPPFFKRNISVACGSHARLHEFHNHTGENIALMRRMAFTGCNHWRCILKRYGLINPEDRNEIVDDAKYFLYLDQWGKYNKAFSKILFDAKVTCKQLNRKWFPLTVCNFFPFQSCIRRFITVNCPVVLETPVCRQWKAFYTECHKWYDTKRK